MRKMSKTTVENKMVVVIKILLLEFVLYCKFMCADEYNNKNKNNKITYSPLLSTPVTVFLIAEKLLSL